MKINTISLTNFRAFPGPKPVPLQLDGQNLLVYGENGSGKSSLFHALRGFFSYGPPPDLLKQCNSFSKASIGEVRVQLEFDDQSSAAWYVKAEALALNGFQGPRAVPIHPAHSAPINTEVAEAAKFSASLDYRSLLNTNFIHGDREINLFDSMVNELLAGFVDLSSNKTIAQLWKAVEQSRPISNTARQVAACVQACQRFNDAVKRALVLLLPEAQAVLQHLSPHGLTLDELPFQGVRYNMAKAYTDKAIVDKRIGFKVSFRGLPLDRPQLFLNEARQSAVALALYLGARLACAPQTTPHFKMLILDDVLIGLDHSNRLPVLGVLESKFAEWQTVLLTHDRGWFDLARERLKTGWVCYEIYEGDAAAAAPMPIARKTENKPGKALLAKGRELLALNYVEAAANYTRQAFEHGLRGTCEFQKVKLNYKIDSKNHKTQDLLDALKAAPKPNTVSQTDWTSCLAQIEMFKNVVMNPYSHPSAPNIPRQEVVDAANAVERFLKLAGKK